MRPTGKARVAGVIGWPIAHSKSPLLHGWWLERLAIDGAYVPLAIRPEDVATALRLLPRLGFVGVNVTVPHKPAALVIADQVDSLARRVGAANTLVFDPAGGITARNTDVAGFAFNLAEGAPGFDPAAGPAVLLGSGGAARAAAVALIDQGVPELRLVCRTGEHGAELAAAVGGPIRVVAWNERAEALRSAALLVNATSLGMAGQPPLDLALDALPLAAVVSDIVYAPLETALLAAARRRGNRAVDGLGMLIHQGRPAFAAFFGAMPEADAGLRDLLLGA